MSFASYEDAESFLLLDKTIVKAEQKYADQRFFDDGVIFQSKKRYMSDTPDGDKFQYYTQSTIVVMTAIPMKRMCWNCPMRQ